MNKPSAIFFERRRKISRRTSDSAVQHYRVDCITTPRNRWIEIRGPGGCLRWLRDGSHDFFSFSELVKSIVRPGMSDLDKAVAVYRFSNRYTHSFDIGFGGTEMTRFLNCFGYSFCWGQGDFQHLLYEAAGLRARSPLLKGHSSAEVLIDGQWRMLDPFMRLMIPDVATGGLATGKMLMDHPETWDHTREGAVLGLAKDYWSLHGPGDTYEPWQDCSVMFLSLRREETLRIGYDHREHWCVAPAEPPDYCNGDWNWQPLLDEDHLAKECDASFNVAVSGRSLTSADPAKVSSVEYRFKSPYPFCTGRFSARNKGGAALQVSISNDGRKSWSVLRNKAQAGISYDLTPSLSRRRLKDGDTSGVIPREAMIFDVVVRLEWTGALVLSKPLFRFLVQIHNPSLPRLAQGVNGWKLLGMDKGTSIAHAWDEYPGLSVSNESPLEGETIVIRAVVHNRGTIAARGVRVRFTQAGTRLVLGQAVIASIPPKGSRTVQIEWVALAKADRRGRNSANPNLYVRSIIRAEVGPDEGAGAWTGVAEAVVTVRPRPRPKFNDDLTWSSDGLYRHDQKLVLRAVLVHLPQDAEILYQMEVALNATITPFLGHPDKGGLKLAEPRRVENIQPSEFGMAEWNVSTHELPKSFDVWLAVQCDDDVEPERRRLLGKRRVQL